MLPTKPTIRFLLAGLTILTAGCALQAGPQAITGGLPADRLAYFCDPFDTIRPDVWEKAGLVFSSEQLSNLEAGEVRIDSGKLRIDTQTGGFSKAGLVSQFSLKGDFDVQIDCALSFIEDEVDMDQVLGFAVIERGETIRTNRAHIIGIGKNGKTRKRFIYSGYLEGGDFHLGYGNRMGDFEGTLRFIRTGDRISSYYKTAGRKYWTSMSTTEAKKSEALVGFVFQNFLRTRSSINATRPLTASFDNFTINAAQEIVEGEI